MTLTEQFEKDNQGRRFADVLADKRISFASILSFFEKPDIQRRMIDSELHQDRPALAGVVRELEHREDVHQFFLNHDGHTTTRFRQAVGVVVRIVMENNGWQTTGRKGSLGVRAKVRTRTTAPGAYHNTGGLALWFIRAERYELVDPAPYRSVEERANEIDLLAKTVAAE